MHFVRPYRKIGELNQVERWKLDRHPLEVADAVIERYAKQGPGAIAKVPGEQERLKWVGLYPQRQGGDAFMMRVKVPGGRADRRSGPRDRYRRRRLRRRTRRQPRLRQPLRRHHHPPGHPDPLDPHRRRAPDLGALRRCGAHHYPGLWRLGPQRPVLPGVGRRRRRGLRRPARRPSAISEFFTGNRDYANLPRKFKISVTGCLEDCAQAEINDIGLWPARAADGTLGFNVLAGGGLSDGERMASDIDVFIAPDQAVELTRAIAQLFGELGNRENRGLARMRYLVQELGPEGFRAELAARTRFPLVPAGESLTRRYRGDHVGVHPQRQDGLVYVGCSVPVGRMSGIELVEAARLAETYGDGTVRLGTDQNFVLERGARRPTSTGCSTRSCCRSTRPSPAPSCGAWWPAPGASSAASPWWRRRSGP